MKKDNKTIGITIRFFTNGLPDQLEVRATKFLFGLAGMCT